MLRRGDAMDILLIFLISCFSYSNWFLGKSMLDRPLITGTIVGLAFGDLASGCIIGAINKRNQNDVAKIPDYHSEH